MRTIKIIIERSEDLFWAYAEGDDPITGGGETVAACMQDVLDCIETLKEIDKKNRQKYAEGTFELVF